MRKLAGMDFDIHHALCVDDAKVTASMLTRRNESRLPGLMEELRDFQSATMTLQEDSITLFNVRDIFREEQDAPCAE